MNPLIRLWHSVETYPWRWSLGMLAPLIIFPHIDLTVSSWFYDAASGTFPARTQAFPEWVRLAMPRILFVIALLAAATWAAGEWLKEPIFGVTRRITAFLLLSLALGPGLIVNVILKDSWGRPRPSTIREFGGTDIYVPPMVMSDQCDKNCSFSSGHGALGFWPVALALLAPPAWRHVAVACAVAFGVVVGFVRIAQGGHFLSDVLVSAIVTVAAIRLLYKWLMNPGEGASPKNNPPIPGESP